MEKDIKEYPNVKIFHNLVYKDSVLWKCCSFQICLTIQGSFCQNPMKIFYGTRYVYSKINMDEQEVRIVTKFPEKKSNIVWFALLDNEYNYIATKFYIIGLDRLREQNRIGCIKIDPGTITCWQECGERGMLINCWWGCKLV